MSTAYLFPGQGSQTSGMGRAFYEAWPTTRERFDALDDAAAGIDLVGLCFDTDADGAAALVRRGRRTFGRLSEHGAPVVAAVDGYCLGGGMELAVHADLRIVAPDATFGLPECDRGLVPGWGGIRRLRDLLGWARATEVILGADERSRDDATVRVCDRTGGRPARSRPRVRRPTGGGHARGQARARRR